jgi:DNA-binding beta-propeller fold protein YncE
VLEPKRTSAVGTGDAPAGIALSPDGPSVYVTNFGDPQLGSGSVSQYDVAGDGSLSFKRPSTVAAGSNPLGVAVSADGQSVYVTSSDSVFQFDAGTGGKLFPQATPTVAAGALARGLALSPLLPTERADVLFGTAGDDVIRAAAAATRSTGWAATTGSSAVRGAT